MNQKSDLSWTKYPAPDGFRWYGLNNSSLTYTIKPDPDYKYALYWGNTLICRSIAIDVCFDEAEVHYRRIAK